MYLSDRCWFLLCTCGRERGGWREGEGIYTVQVQLEFQPPFSHPPLTHAHVWYIKLPMYLFFYMGLYLVVFRGGGGQIQNSVHFGGGVGGSKWPLLWPPQNHYISPHHINNRYINSYCMLICSGSLHVIVSTCGSCTLYILLYIL